MKYIIYNVLIARDFAKFHLVKNDPSIVNRNIISLIIFF